ncbi:anti-sigma factor [Aquimarina sp. 2201CG14-23]|uniref:anti-sigma factor n=1 Tax=Aquimarina mycalae TaxID=3040073 RepID=UPI002477EA3D|nr:anti-sigma factor [Aquimarina sp. 2201CG14-23]MDH7445601.1 anti-sigma factor [Aquimarina sp. 2201CG14-23]
MMKKKMMAIMTIALGLLGVSCSSDDGPPVANVSIETIGLETLTGGSTYQGWLIVNGQAVPTSRFTNPTGTVNLTVLASDLEDASEFVLTIEPVGDTDNVPSNAKILTGSFNGSNSATLNFAPVVADLSSTSGQFFLATPTDDVADNDEFGVWFMNGSAAGLSLPALASGWKYEGWVDFGNKIVSTGTFSDVDVTDDANFFKGSGGVVPNFPGEDFLIIPSQIPLTGITFPAAVTSKRVFITVEPFEDKDPAPFFIEPLSGTAGITTGSANPVLMISDTSVPSGRATRPSM